MDTLETATAMLAQVDVDCDSARLAYDPAENRHPLDRMKRVATTAGERAAMVAGGALVVAYLAAAHPLWLV